jgi:hypothetical protein
LAIRDARYHPGMRRPGTALAAAVATALLAAGAFALAPAADAHVPFLEPYRPSDAPAAQRDPFPGAIPLPDVAVSRAVYGTLAPGEAFDAYRLTVSRPSSTPVEMLVPKTTAYRAFRPAFALVGPGLPAGGTPPPFIAQRLRTAYTAVSLVPGAYPQVLVVPDPGVSPRPTFYEPFSFSTYYRGGATRVDLKPGVTYYLVVYDSMRQTGPYALGIGTAERFTAGDALRSIVAVARIKLGLYGQGAFSWPNAVIMAALLACLVALAVLAARRLRARAGAAGR